MSTKHSLAAFCAAVLLFVGFVAIGRAYVVHRATELIADTQSLDRASDSTAASLSFAKKYHRYLADTTCDRNFCQYRFVFSNRVLSVPRLAKRAEIEVIVSVFHERLDTVMTGLTSNVYKENSPVVHVTESLCKDRTDIPCTDFAINPHGRDVQPSWNGHIFIGQLATGNQKHAAWAFNFDCLITYKGCRDISELNPLIWRRTNPDRVSSKVRSTADSMAETAQPLPN